MANKRPDLIRRQQAVEKTLRKYGRVPFEWGKFDCVAMLRSHLVAMGHRKVPKVPAYRSAAEAKAALKKAGFASVEALLDSLLPRIPPATALPGDIVLLAGEHGLGGVTVSVGHKVAGWHQDAEGMEILAVRETVGAWRA